MEDEIDWKLVESTGNGIVIIKSELPYFRDAVLQNKPIESDIITQKFKKNGICDQYGFLTERGRVVAISYLPLEDQCRILNLRLYYEPINIIKGTEVSTLEFYKAKGYVGCFSEGDIIRALLYSIFYDQLLEALNKKDENLDEDYLSFENITKDHRFKLIDLMKNVNTQSIKKNFEKLSKNFFINDYTREHLDSDLLIKIYNGLGNDKLTKIVKIYFDNIYASLYGWPDLTLVKDNNVKLIEIKKKDKLRRSQIITLDTLIKSTNLDISVLKVI